MQKYYKKYDEMIIDLEYDEEQDIVKFNNTDKTDLNCVWIIINSIIEKHQASTKTKRRKWGRGRTKWWTRISWTGEKTEQGGRERRRQ